MYINNMIMYFVRTTLMSLSGSGTTPQGVFAEPNGLLEATFLKGELRCFRGAFFGKYAPQNHDKIS